MTTTWVVAADHSRARFFKIESSNAPLEELDTLVHSEGRLHDRDMTADLPGKVKNPGGQGGGHAFEQRTDPKAHEADVFAGQIVQHLEEAHNAHRFGRLILTAEPSMLGLVRQHLPKTLSAAVSLALDKNLTGMSAADIRAHLPEYLPH